MISLLLASSLWLAANEAGARADAPQAMVQVPLEKIANPLAVDLVVNAFGTSLDLGSTDWAIHQDAGCFEGNSLVPRPESRIAAKIALGAFRGGVAYILRRTGHNGWANGLRIGGAVIDVALTANNLACGLRNKK